MCDNLKIIIADDSREDVELMKIALQEIGHTGEVTWLKDGEMVVDYFKKSNDFKDREDSKANFLMLLDLNMPKKNGLEVLEVLRSEEGTKSLPIVMLTTSQSEQDTLKAYAAGANNYLIKPFDFDAIVELLKDLTHYWKNIAVTPALTI